MHKNTRIVAALFSLLPITLAAPASAINDTLEYNIAGFASFGYAKALNADPEKSTVNPTKTFADLNGVTDEGEYRALNILGLRLDTDLNEKLAFAAQMVMKGNRGYSPRFSWLYATYSFTPSLKVFIGKTQMPLYMHSDFLDAKYAYQWITPPESLYGGKLLEFNTGLQISWNQEIGDNWYTRLNAWAGEDKQYIALLGINVNLDSQAGISWSVQNDWFTLRAAYSSAKSSFDENVNNLFYQKINTGITSSGAPSLNKEDITWDGNGDRSYYSGVGIGFRFERFYVIAEAVYLEIPEINFAISDSTGGYIGAGFNINEKWSLHTTYNRSKDGYNKDIANNYATQNAGVLPAPVINAISNTINDLVRDEQEREMESISLGARWDFHKNAALKLEYTKAKITEGTSKERTPDTLALEADFVF